jgi:dTDP-4-dehydrorhamnose reductase
MRRDGGVLVVGGDSTIGGELFRRLATAGVRAVGTTRRSSADPSTVVLDLAADPSTWAIPDRVEVAFLCAAITSIDRCRQKPAEARLVNVARTIQLATRLRSRGGHVVFLSTNQVFDGTRPCARPDDPTNPRTEYGRQKAEVERALLAEGGVTVVRFTKVIAPGMVLLHSWVEALRRGAAIEPFEDMVMSPIPLGFAAGVLACVGDRKLGGIVQVSGAADVSYARIARRLAERLRTSCDLVRPVSCESKGVPRESAPVHTTLDTTRLVSELSMTVPPVGETIDALIEGTLHG